MTFSENLQDKLECLKKIISRKKVIVAFSGGVDSSLLAFIAHKYAKETLLVTENSILYPSEEIEETKTFALKYDIPHMIIERNPLEVEDFRSNPKNRCYICKKGLYNEILQIKEEKGYDMVLDGSNYDDLQDFRPGMLALQELSIDTPYLNCRITKQEIRLICEQFNLEVKSKPSMACFSSRIPYGQDIDEKKLNRIRDGEKFLKEFLNIRQVRVRHHDNNLARIEIMPEELVDVLDLKKLSIIVSKFKDLGFTYITLDMEGFRSGSMNEVLN
ncbi:MAG: ATP-dependent sacrificial sulfur transferase LarE [Candidatus Lokiarchaeota archaeon]|nr:ATP-dependent sacrificial sulfur transferase LarE [Candidatus Lokiarchaeota archaeon]